MSITVIHPGEHLAEELRELGMSAAELARQLDIPTNRVTEIQNGRRAITGDTALRLAHFFGTTAEFWLNLQSLYDLRIAQKKVGKCGERSRSRTGESRSTTCMVPPQTGSSRVLENGRLRGMLLQPRFSAASWSKRKQSGKSIARCRLARKPKLRMRTKPRGSKWSRKRRRNSSTGRVMSRFLLPWAESRQRKVTLPSESATSLELEMATRWV